MATMAASQPAAMRRSLTVQEIEQYHGDGVIMLKQMFSPVWIELLNRGFEANLANPTERGQWLSQAVSAMYCLCLSFAQSHTALPPP